MLAKTNTPFMLQKGKKTFITEQFRKLRNSLEYIGIGLNGKKVLITSTVSGEGKSFVTVNLGLSLAMTGKKVVLVEFDLSNPTLAEKLRCETQIGIADYLIGNAEPQEIITQIKENENLFLISAGALPEDSSDLILNSRVKQLFSYLENRFDFILVDTAPVGLLSDGYVLSKYCDATLYIVRHHYTPKVMLERLDESNKINELKNLALVFNAVSSRGFVKSHGYGYGYGYGYIEEKEAMAKVNIN